MKRTWPLLALLTIALPAVGADMYSWTDANGVKHFSDSPPPANVVKSQKLKVKGGVTSAAAPDEAPKDAAPAASGPALAAAAGYAPEDIKRNCTIARRNLAALDTTKPALDARGQPADPDAAQSHQAQVDKTNQQIKLFCAQ